MKLYKSSNAFGFMNQCCSVNSQLRCKKKCIFMISNVSDHYVF